MTRSRLLLLSLGLSLALVAIAPLSSAYYGDVTMNRTAGRFGVPAVVFPHWTHRVQYTCDACHPSIFRMQAGAHEILMERMAAKAQYCLACHDGKTAWAPVNCSRCHVSASSERADPAKVLSNLPREGHGTVDWNESLRRQLITPRRSSAKPDAEPVPPDTLLMKTAPMPPVKFSHTAHGSWLRCANCHPEPFAKGKGANPISMEAIWSGKFCGACHGLVAFPVTQCDRCHSGSSQAGNEAERLAGAVRDALSRTTSACVVSTLDGRPVARVDPTTGQRLAPTAATAGQPAQALRDAPAGGRHVQLWSLTLTCP